MIKFGNWLDRCDMKGLTEDKGYNSYRAMYEEYASWRDVVKTYKLDCVRTLTVNDIKHVVILEIYDGSINQSFTLEDETECFKVYSGVSEEYIFNTDGAAFMEFQKDGVEVATFMIDNSPSDVGSYNEEDWYDFTCGRDTDEFSREIALQEFRDYLKDKNDFFKLGMTEADLLVTAENTVFVTQL